MWQIRVGLAVDRDSVKNLWEAAGLDSGSENEWQTLVGSPRAELLVAEEAGAVVGACVAAFDGWRAFVYHLVVAQTHRRRGVAAALLKAAESDVHGRGAQRVFAIVNEAMTDGLALCVENGYEPEGDLVLVKELDR